MFRVKWCAGIFFSILCLSIAVSANQSSINQATDLHNPSPNYSNYPEYIPYSEFISINNDEDFLDYNITGLGTKEDPHIIENIVLDEEEYDNSIAVRDTTKHFVIRNCTLRGWWHCIFIENVKEGTANICNNTCFVYPPELGSIEIGIYITNGATIRRNNCTREYTFGGWMEGTYGIVIQHSDNTKVVENICEKQALLGIYSVFSDNNLFEKNTCILNSDGAGLCISDS